MAELTINAEEIAAALRKHVETFQPSVDQAQIGRVLTGIITTETASSITLKQPEGKVEVVLRDDIDELKGSGLSLMPVGLEKNIDAAQMADLITFLKNWRYIDGNVPAGK